MIIGVDIGGTEIKAGQVAGKRILKKAVVGTGGSRKEIIKNLIECISAVFDKKAKGIGIGMPGPADYEKGVIGKTPNLPLKGVNIKKIISKRFKKKILMNNDANCFVLGESKRLRKKNVVGLTLGTGVGGGVVIDGKLYVGNGNAGELGHCTIKYDGKKGDFNQGSLESYVSGKAIIRDYGKYPRELKSAKAWNEIGGKLGIGIANLINAFDPDAVVIGGGISKAFSKFKAGMNKEISKRAVKKVPVVKGSSDSGIVGAASLF
ncbi:ROK family protein [Candidatus Woesearchaeota archaeon]|nr:ROK family protein [Candidatus Woesearchaeota archaeon]